jgi:hypothetical protein
LGWVFSVNIKSLIIGWWVELVVQHEYQDRTLLYWSSNQ